MPGQGRANVDGTSDGQGRVTLDERCHLQEKTEKTEETEETE